MKILCTGSAGFIGFHLSRSLLEQGHEVFGIDNLNEYYDRSLKQARLEMLMEYQRYRHNYLSIEHGFAITPHFQGVDMVIHLAAQAGVRYSLTNPQAYIDANVTGFLNVLEGCRIHSVPRLLYASSSSVYGKASLYGVTKAMNEDMAQVYHDLHGVSSTGMRFFTVYGPWGRPDMALFKFTKAITEGEPVELYNRGNHVRSFTYIDDVVRGIQWAMEDDRPIIDIGNPERVGLRTFLGLIEVCLGRCQAEVKELPLQPGDVEIGAFPDCDGDWTPVTTGIPRFIKWYQKYYAEKMEETA